jgi:Flp pilus assembly protein TadG
MKNHEKSQNGQAIVLIALSLLVLVAFAGLAIDGGMVYSDRRHAQNASDAGSLAGAGQAAIHLENSHVAHASFNCGASSVQTAISLADTAARNQMLANEYGSADVSVSFDCQDTDPSYFDEKYIDITTQIITDTQTALIHVVYDGPVHNRVTATTRIKPQIPLAYGHAVVALNDETDCDNASAGGVKFGGTGDVEIDGGGVWSNGCLVAQGDCSVVVNNGGIAYGGGNFGTCPTMSPGPTDMDDILPEEAYLIPTPDCGATGAVRVDDIRLSGHQTLDLNATYAGNSLICLTDTGNALQMTGGTLTGSGITIYMENGGDIVINGGVANLEGPPSDPDTSPGIPGVIFYANPAHESDIDITGNISSTYLGLIYGPAADIKISGTGDVGPVMNTQVIGYNVELLGTARIDINFDTTWNYTKPTSIDLQK